MKQEKQREEQPKIINELTLMQKVALQGEVAMCYETAMHQADKVYNTYILLFSLYSESYLPFYKQEMLEFVDEETIAKCYRYVVQDMFPNSIYIDKFISDIRGHLGKSECNVKDRMPKIAKPILKCKYVSLIRVMGEVLPSLAREIISAVTSDEDLDFLHDVSYSLLMEMSGAKDLISEVLPKIKVCQTTLIESMPISFIKETQALDTESTRAKQKDLLAFVDSIMKQQQEENVEPIKEVYQVNKIDKATKTIVFTKEFSSQAKAVEYVKGIGKDYPDILQRYEFKIQKQTGE